MTFRLKTGAIAAVALMGASPALAHHSFAMFDHDKEVPLTGVVKEFQWTNPHSWIQLMVTDKAGKTIEYSIEGASVNSLARQGWTRKAFKPGDKVTVFVNPLKTGEPGGSFVRAVLPDGSKLPKDK